MQGESIADVIDFHAEVGCIGLFQEKQSAPVVSGKEPFGSSTNISTGSNAASPAKSSTDLTGTVKAIYIPRRLKRCGIRRRMERRGVIEALISFPDV